MESDLPSFLYSSRYRFETVCLRGRGDKTRGSRSDALLERKDPWTPGTSLDPTVLTCPTISLVGLTRRSGLDSNSLSFGSGTGRGKGMSTHTSSLHTTKSVPEGVPGPEDRSSQKVTYLEGLRGDPRRKYLKTGPFWTDVRVP